MPARDRMTLHEGGNSVKKRNMTDELVAAFLGYLEREEKSKNTVEKYIRDVTAFQVFMNGRRVDKEAVIAYKNKLLADGYAVSSINSMLAALNAMFTFLGWLDTKVKLLRQQRKIYSSEEKELSKAEYERLLLTARKAGNNRLDMLLQTLCATGIRVSELPFITVEAARNGKAIVYLKGKSRTVFIVHKLQKRLLQYARGAGIKTGAIFVSRTGKVMDRTNIWKEMKKLCEQAKVNPKKVFPHNLRHLFARTFYEMEKDIAKLADVLGHSNVNTTRIYIISTGIEHRKCMEHMKLII